MSNSELLKTLKYHLGIITLNENQIELKHLVAYLFSKKLVIVIVTILCAVASVFYALSLPNKYTTEVILSPSLAQSSGGLQALSSQYGGLAALAGINLEGGSGNRIEEAVILAQSWPFISDLIGKNNLKPEIVAVESWNPDTGILSYKKDLYDGSNRSWLFEGKETLEPSDWETYENFIKYFSVSQDKKSGLVTVKFEHISPEFSLMFVNLLVQEINQHFQLDDITGAKNNIKFLKRQVEETEYKGMQTVFFNMLEEQTKTLMLANADDDYVFKTLVPGKLAEEKSSPVRSLICIAITIGGFLMCLVFLLAKFLYEELNK